MIQSTAWLLTLLLIIPVAALFAAAALLRAPAADPQALVARSYALRTWAFWGIVAGVTPVLLYTLTLLPYGADAAPASEETQVVEVSGRMWQWQLSETEVKAGEPVRFEVTSDDVNHGLGIYDSDLVLQAQTQAMPEYTNVLEHTFDEPGTYQFFCLEYCGVAHHDMVAELTVRD